MDAEAVRTCGGRFDGLCERIDGCFPRSEYGGGLCAGAGGSGSTQEQLAVARPGGGTIFRGRDTPGGGPAPPCNAADAGLGVPRRDQAGTRPDSPNEETT